MGSNPTPAAQVCSKNRSKNSAIFLIQTESDRGSGRFSFPAGLRARAKRKSAAPEPGTQKERRLTPTLACFAGTAVVSSVAKPSFGGAIGIDHIPRKGAN